MNEAGNGKKVMTVKEVSDFLRIPLSTIYDLVKSGKLRGAKFGRQWRFLEEDILSYFSCQR
jgi:excisionase family DNA binding protein